MILAASVVAGETLTGLKYALSYPSILSNTRIEHRGYIRVGNSSTIVYLTKRVKIIKVSTGAISESNYILYEIGG